MLNGLRRVEPGDRIGLLPLLLLADDAEDQVRSRLDEGWLFVLSDDGIDVGAVLVVPHDQRSMEFALVAIAPRVQRQGVGRQMLLGVLDELADLGCQRVVVGTSNAGVGQIAFYQKCGFRLLRVDRDHFDEARGYDGTQSENGIVHRDLVWFDQELRRPEDAPPSKVEAARAGMPHDWHEAMRRAVHELGNPIYGLAGPLATEGVLNGHGGSPCTEVTLLYRTGTSRIEVHTGRRPLGGTDRMVSDVLQRVGWDSALPFSMTVSERLVMLPVAGTQTQFRVIESTSGHWTAAGGLGKRHLLLTGTPGVAIEDLALTPVSLDFDA